MSLTPTRSWTSPGVLLEALQLDAHEHRLPGRAGDLLLQLLDRLGVDGGDGVGDLAESPFDVLELGVGRRDPVGQEADRVVEPGADPPDVGVDVGDPGPELLGQPGLSGDDPLVDPVLGLVDPLADDLGRLGLLTSGGGGHLVEAYDDAREALVDVTAKAVDSLVRAHFEVTGDGVEVGDHPCRLLVEATKVLVERSYVAGQPVVAVLEILHDRPCCGLDRCHEPGVQLVDHAADPLVQLVVATLRGPGQVVDGRAQLCRVDCVPGTERTLDGAGQRTDLLVELTASAALRRELVADAAELGGDLLAEGCQLALHRPDDPGLHRVELLHRCVVRHGPASSVDPRFMVWVSTRGAGILRDR